jgi:putative thiamine transport system substrate-binding protein
MDRRQFATMIAWATLGSAVPKGRARAQTVDWDAVAKAARGQTVYWHAWGGDPRSTPSSTG